MPHTPPQRLLKKYNKDGRALDVAKYYAMVDWFDETSGQLMSKLDEKGLRENTVVIYIYDNGWGAASTTLDWPRDQAFKEYAMRSKASPTALTCSRPSPQPPGWKAPDGLPGINLLDEKAVNGRDTIFGSLNSSHNITIEDADAALQYLWCIEGDWKLLRRYHGEDKTHYKKFHEWDTAPYRLFHLGNDPGEKNDLVIAHPGIVERLKKKITAWRQGF